MQFFGDFHFLLLVEYFRCGTVFVRTDCINCGVEFFVGVSDPVAEFTGYLGKGFNPSGYQVVVVVGIAEESFCCLNVEVAQWRYVIPREVPGCRGKEVCGTEDFPFAPYGNFVYGDLQQVANGFIKVVSVAAPWV